MSAPLVTLIIPAYNEEQRIAKAIESALAQTYQNLEVIVVNDGSTDNTGEVVQAQYPQVQYIEQENKRLAGARNTGIRAARGKYVSFLDADDELMPEKTTRQVEVLEAHPDISAVSTNAEMVQGRWRWLLHNPRGPRLVDIQMPWIICRGMGPVGIGTSLMVRTELLRQLGGYDERLRAGEERDLFHRLAASEPRLVYLNEPLYRVSVRPGSLSDRSEVARGHAFLRLLRKWDPRKAEEKARHPITQAEYAQIIANQVLTIAVSCQREGLPEEARKYLQALDDLPRLQTRFRLLRWLAKRAWWLASQHMTILARHRNVTRLITEWGLTGAAKRYLLLNRAARSQE